jgi:putative endonuclease
MFYVYVIKSQVDGRLYKGLTQNIENRIRLHNKGKTKSTKPFRPWKLVYYESFNSREHAREREKFFKTGRGRDFIKKIIYNKMIDVFTKYGSEGWGFPARRRQAGGPARRQAGTLPRFTTNLKPPFLRLFLYFCINI